MKRFFYIPILIMFFSLGLQAEDATLYLNGHVEASAKFRQEKSGPGHFVIRTNSNRPITIKLHKRQTGRFPASAGDVDSMQISQTEFLSIDPNELEKIEIIAP